MSSSYLTRESILGAKDLQRAEVEVPEWGGKVLVRGMTANERADFEKNTSTAKTKVRGGGRKGAQIDYDIEMHAYKVRVLVAQWCIIDEDGKRIFQPADVKELGEKSDAALRRCFDKIMDLSGLSADAEEAIEGESEGSLSDESSSE